MNFLKNLFEILVTYLKRILLGIFGRTTSQKESRVIELSPATSI